VKTLLKSVHIYQSYCKKNLAQFFLAHPVGSPRPVVDSGLAGVNYGRPIMVQSLAQKSYFKAEIFATHNSFVWSCVHSQNAVVFYTV